MGKNSYCCGSCYCYWLDSCGFSIVDRSCAIAVIITPKASVSVACVAAIAIVSVLDARTVTESFVDAAKYLLNERIYLVINTIHQENLYRLYSRIRTLSELNYVPFAPVVVRIGDLLRSHHLV